MRGKFGQALGILFIILFWGGVIFGIFWLTHQSKVDSSANSSQSSTSSSDSTQPSDDGYDNCTEAHDAGVYDIPESSSAYKSSQDADGDGVACEHYYNN
jgi:hypothetical protein